MRRLGQAVVVVVALFATVATSPARWSVEAPGVTAQGEVLDAARPTGEVAFRVDGVPELAKRGDEVNWNFGLHGTARWEGASDPNASSVLHVEYVGLVVWGQKDPLASVDVVLRPGQTVELDASNPLRTACGEVCRFTMRARYRWEQPDGRVEIAWAPRASASIFLQRRRREPSEDAKVTISEIR